MLCTLQLKTVDQMLMVSIMLKIDSDGDNLMLLFMMWSHYVHSCQFFQQLDNLLMTIPQNQVIWIPLTVIKYLISFMKACASSTRLVFFSSQSCIIFWYSLPSFPCHPEGSMPEEEFFTKQKHLSCAHLFSDLFI